MKGPGSYRPAVTGRARSAFVAPKPGGKTGSRHAFKKERDLRAWVKMNTADPFWIEPTRGSTVGVPDTFVLEGDGVWMELKLGVCKDRRLLKWKLRPGQYDRFRTLRSRGLRVGALVGFRNAIFVTTDPETFRRGWAEIREEDLADARKPGTWAEIVAKIVSDCKS